MKYDYNEMQNEDTPEHNFLYMKKHCFIMSIFTTVIFCSMAYALDITLESSIKILLSCIIVLVFFYYIMISSLYKYKICMHHAPMTLIFSLSGFFLMSMYAVPIVYVMLNILQNSYLTAIFCIFSTLMVLFYIVNAVRVLNRNFSKLYSVWGKCVFFDYWGYQKIKDEVPYFRYVIVILLMGITFFIGMYSKSFYYKPGFGIALALAMFGLVLLLCPVLISGIYAYILHRRVEKIFKKKLISDKWNLLEKDPKLAEKILGKNPQKKPIQYEEVFPNSRV